MTFVKLGELIELAPNSVQDNNSVIPIVDSQVLSNFAKFAANLKKIAPKAEDFLYFSAVMMHAAEASILNEDGTPKLTAKGEVVTANWDKSGGSWRWKSNDPSIKPYKNSNGDIFPEEELVRAYKKWIHKPLCIDHKSSSVDHVRGFIVDTVYDRQLKRVIALCALDKQNYPDLARKVATGYSSSVSMGTAVGRAICSDCGTVAKTEADFCKCMRNKTCYGEINIDLSPIELSIVVNGADPKAHIKHIIAAAQTLNSYVEQKKTQLEKLANQSFRAYLTFGESNLDNPGQNSVLNVDVNSTDLESFKNDLSKALNDYESLNSKLNEENLVNDTINATNDSASSQTNSSVAMAETETESTDFSLAPPVQRFASTDVQEVRKQLATIEGNLKQMQKDFDKLANNITNNSKQNEEIMSGSKDNSLNKQGYYQGAGGVNEPTPGQVKYPKDSMNEDLRDSGDKQMTGPTPFPGVGSVDGMYPGVGEKDLEIKKMHARAQADERAQKRAALVNKAKEALENKKIGYYLGGGGVNEPTPGKTKYPVDSTQDDLRDKEDKQMVGQKPFPDVGKVDGLHPSPASADVADELKRKEMLARAESLKARFIKASKEDGSHDKGSSAWEVYRGEKLILTASVDEITDGNTENLYSGVATKEYGTELINKVKALGAAKVKSSFKKVAQDMAPPPAAPEMPAPDMGVMPDDTGKEGDPKDTALELSEKVKDLSSDLAEAVKALTGEQAEMGEMAADDNSATDESKVTTAALNSMRKELNPALLAACKEAVASLNDHEQELNTIVAMYEKGAVNETNKDFVNSLVEDAVVEAKESFADSFKLLEAFVKYARGTQAMVKRAEESQIDKEAHGDMMPGNTEEGLMAMVDKAAPAMDAGLAEDADGSSAMNALDAMLASDMPTDDTLNDDDTNDAVLVPDAETAAQVAKSDPNVSVEVKKAGLETKAERAAARAKLAAEMKWNPMLSEFHKHVDDGPALEVKPSGDLAKVETIEDTHDAMMDLATAPVKVRKEAEAIQKLIAEGKLNSEDLPKLVANGLDGDAVKYWKQFYGQAGSEGSQFASELVKEHAKAQLEEQMSLYKVKIARAYELAYEMVDRGLLARDRGAITAQVDEVMKWNDEGFESMKRVIAKHTPLMAKEAGRMPQVGLFGSEEVSSAGSEDMATLLAQAFSKSGKRLF